MGQPRMCVEELRKARGWSQRELSRRSGISQSTLSAIENGETTSVEFVTMDRLADVFGVPPAMLFVLTDRRVLGAVAPGVE